MEIRIIKTDEQYRRSLAEIRRLATGDPHPDSAEGARLELLAKLVEDYEKLTFPLNSPDPVDAIVFRMEQLGLRQKDLAELLGGKNRASEVLARKRPLTLPMIRALHRHLAIPSELLIREPAVEYVVGAKRRRSTTTRTASSADVHAALFGDGAGTQGKTRDTKSGIRKLVLRRHNRG